jgi:hypothetical protein
MMRRMTVVAAILLISTSMLSGCMGLILARESIEELREPAIPSIRYEKISITQIWNTLEVQPYTNRSTFIVDESTNRISIYLKVNFNWPALVNQSQFVRATLTDAEGTIQWQEDVSSDYEPTEKQLLPAPAFAMGEWVLNVEARGYGESFVNQVKDEFSLRVTIEKSCIQYPLEESCF